MLDADAQAARAVRRPGALNRRVRAVEREPEKRRACPAARELLDPDVRRPEKRHDPARDRGEALGRFPFVGHRRKPMWAPPQRAIRSLFTRSNEAAAGCRFRRIPFVQWVRGRRGAGANVRRRKVHVGRLEVEQLFGRPQGLRRPCPAASAAALAGGGTAVDEFANHQGTPLPEPVQVEALPVEEEDPVEPAPPAAELPPTESAPTPEPAPAPAPEPGPPPPDPANEFAPGASATPTASGPSAPAQAPTERVGGEFTSSAGGGARGGGSRGESAPSSVSISPRAGRTARPTAGGAARSPPGRRRA